jgi:hypothetical protein
LFSLEPADHLRSPLVSADEEMEEKADFFFKIFKKKLFLLNPGGQNKVLRLQFLVIINSIT